jgi:hypothetical protein
MQQSKRNRQERLHAAIHMDTKDLQPFTAIGTPYAARMTSPTINVRLDRTSISDMQSETILRNFNDLARKFVAQNPGIGICGMAPCESMKVAATNANLPYANKCLSCLNLWPWNLSFD